MNAKKLLALLLAVVMVVCVFAACDDNDQPTDPVVTTEPATYTYNTALSVFPASWNPHTYEESASGDVLGYIEDGFWTFDYNEDETGFTMVPAMCVDNDPVDITSQYVGKYGIEEGDTQMVYKINLRDDLCWETGEKITANDFVESAKRLLNPAAQNYRADSFYSGDVVIYNAQEYLKQGQSGWFAAKSTYGTYSEDLDSVLVFSIGPATEEMKAECYVRTYFGFPASYDVAATANYLISNYIGESAFTADMAVAMEGKTFAEIKADPAMKAAWDALIGFWQTEPNEELDFFVTNYTYPELDFSEVGVFALSDTELVYVLTSPMKGFYLKYGMPSGYLVHLATYDACQSIDENGIYTSTYGTSVETTKSYGTYKLTYYQTDKEMRYERNDLWYGLTEDTYQTTDINVQYVTEASTRLGLFLAGDLDVYGLSADDFATYRLSDHTYYSESPSTFGMVFNPGAEPLKAAEQKAGENKDKEIINLIEFRQAMSYGMNRPEFTAATDPAGVTAYGLLSAHHIVDPDTGIGFRNTEEAKDVLVDFWGLAEDIGEGKLYANKDEAIASLTGYNPEKAKALFDAAYDKAIAEGLMDEDDVVEICVGMPTADSVFYNNGYNFIVNNYTELVKGTKLEGKLTFTRNDTLGQNYSTALKNNDVDMLFGVGWQGMQMNPYGLIMAYMTQQYQYDANTDYTVIPLTLTLDGVDYTATVHEWYEIINGISHTITAADGTSIEYICGSADADADPELKQERLYILARIEWAVLMNYNFIPLNGDAGAQLKGQQLNYYKETYDSMMGFGGIKYMTYNYTDAEWEEYVAQNGGKLDYT